MPSSVETQCVAPELVEQVWPHVEALLAKATQRCGDWTTGEIESALRDDRALLWIASDGTAISAAAVTQALEVPRGLICLVVACGGHSPSWPDALRPIENYARQRGCVAMRIQGRPGWARTFRDYDTEFVSLEKRLD